jgi:hypothetical protein
LHEKAMTLNINIPKIKATVFFMKTNLILRKYEYILPITKADNKSS